MKGLLLTSSQIDGVRAGHLKYLLAFFLSIMYNKNEKALSKFERTCKGGLEAMEGKAMEKVKTLEKAIKVLDVIRDADGPLGVNEIARLSDLNLTTIFRTLQTLKGSGWVYQDKNDKYMVGPKIYYNTDRNNFYVALKEVAYYSMVRLSASTAQAMNLVVRENHRCFILQQSRTEKIVDYVPSIGTFLPIYASACGKVLLSELPEVLVNSILDLQDFRPLTPHTITSRSAIVQELSLCRVHGYALDRHETQEQGFCIAVPVRDHAGEICAALSFSGLLDQVTEKDIETYHALLTRGAQEITDNLFKVWKH